ncbi:integrase family protein [Desulfatibacillum aliphaticivorans]|uniref:Integrase family protein n=1 Tax=Desulfatibacillum aliphaticivorans TaxID=218208 RepID=B8F9V7_DESAL|nr:site-specific integrase [Desulfatibacillum aliphaticivorans]ACL03053.1 integrase family protein [Desulfatibacillum aliphaticivorans]
MPWRKYSWTQGKHGRCYKIGVGVNVRCDKDKIWRVYVNRGDQRKNRTMGAGREGLASAIKAAEKIAKELSGIPTPSALPPPNHCPDFTSYAKDWLKAGKDNNKWKIYTWERYEQLLRIHILPSPVFKNRAMDKIQRQEITTFLENMGENRSPATVEAAHSVIHSILDKAMHNGHIDSNPAHRLLKYILPAKNERDQKEPAPFKIKERDRFLETAEKMCNRSEVMILKMMVHAGLRLGETLAMKEEGLDLERGSYHITETFKRDSFSKPKTKKSRRKVDLPDFLVEDLKRHVIMLRRESLERGKGGDISLLFPDPATLLECPYSQKKIQGLMKKVCRKAKLRMRNPHDLRHTYATIMLEAHQSPAYVQRQMGHSSIQITVDIYGHLAPGAGKRQLDEALMPSKKTGRENSNHGVKRSG